MGAREQRLVFGEMADEYDDVRAGYQTALVDTMFDYWGVVPHVMVEIGAGTGKATIACAAQVRSVTCVEPDPPGVALFDPDRRLSLAYQALTPGGMLALFGHAYSFVDPDLRAEAHDAYLRAGTFTTTTVRYPPARYVTLLATFSNRRMLAPRRRAALHAAIARTIDARGGVPDVRLDTELILARPAA